MTATNTLENLADNFNRLSNIDAMSHNKTIHFYHLISELIVLTSTKAKQQSKSIECFVDNAIPLKMYEQNWPEIGNFVYYAKVHLLE